MRIPTNIKVLASLFFVISAFAKHPTEPRVDIADKPTLLRVLSNPEKYHGKSVTLVGFLSLAFESTALYLHQDDSIHGNTDNAIWVPTDHPIPKPLSHLNHQYVIISGTFDATNHGHMGLWLGALVKVTNCVSLESRARPKVVIAKDPPPPPIQLDQ